MNNILSHPHIKTNTKTLGMPIQKWMTNNIIKLIFSVNILYLPVCEVVLAEVLPQQPVLCQYTEVRTHLPQTDQVSSVWEPLHDVQLETDR